jgi:dolichol-phosphate mannosyltransferase
MIFNKRVVVIIPVYNVGSKAIEVINNIPDFVDKIYLVDDCCPLKTGELVEKHFTNTTKLKVIYNSKNLGVGGAVKIGYVESLKNNFDFTVKIDGDGQMNPIDIIKLIEPLQNNYEYTKGNRFLDRIEFEHYPIVRFYGNIFLSFLSKLSTGYWDIFDPINGFTCIKNSILKKINLQKISDGYFFETDMLCNIYFLNGKVLDVPVKIKYYSNQIQNMSVLRETFNFFFKNISKIRKRIRLKYLSNNFTIGGFYIILTLIFFFSSLLIGGFNWIKYGLLLNVLAPTGIVLFSILSFFFSIIFFGFFIYFDTKNNPNIYKNL